MCLQLDHYCDVIALHLPSIKQGFRSVMPFWRRLCSGSAFIFNNSAPDDFQSFPMQEALCRLCSKAESERIWLSGWLARQLVGLSSSSVQTEITNIGWIAVDIFLNRYSWFPEDEFHLLWRFPEFFSSATSIFDIYCMSYWNVMKALILKLKR